MSLPARSPKGLQEQEDRVRRVLVYRLGSLGDTVVSLPCLHRVAQVFPAAERRLLTNFPVAAKAPAASAVLGSSELIHGYERYAVGTRSPVELAGLVWRIRRWNPDVLVYLAAGRGLAAAQRDARFFRLCGIRRIVGLPDTDDLQKTRVLADGLHEREASRLARTLSAIGSPDLDRRENWDLRLTPEEHAKAEAALTPLGSKPFLVISLGTKAQANYWGVRNWQALIPALMQTFPDHAVVAVGAGEEHAMCDEVFAPLRATDAGAGLLNLCGAMSPRVSAAVCARAVLFLGHDSGPLHLAASVGTPCVGVYGSRNQPGVWFPYGDRHQVVHHMVDCTGCGLVTCTTQFTKCILSITVAEVLRAAERAMRSHPSLTSLS